LKAKGSILSASRSGRRFRPHNRGLLTVGRKAPHCNHLR
jgi:hypothetical protein